MTTTSKPKKLDRQEKDRQDPAMMANDTPNEPQPASKRGMTQLWVAVVCIILSQLLGILWLWSLICGQPMH